MLKPYTIQTFMDAIHEHRGVIIITVISLCVLIASTIYIVWSTSIHKQLQFLQNSAFFTNWYEQLTAKSRTSGTNNLPQKDPFRMIRCRIDNNDVPQPSISNIHMLSLNPDFVIYCNNLNNEMVHSKNSISSSSPPPPPPQQQQHSPQPWNVMSLGEYISSLRPFFTAPSGIDGRRHRDQESSSESSSMIPNWVEGEIQAALAVALFATVGPQFGTAILPTLGLNLMQKTVRKIASVLSSYMPNFENEDHKEKEKSEKGDDVDDIYSDLGSVPLSISTMSTGAEINYQRSQRKQKKNNQKGSSMKDTLSPLDLLRIGEVGYPLSFARCEDCNARNVEAAVTVDDLPNPFIVSEHWYSTIEQMEERMKCNDETYDPFSFRMQPPPKVVDERFFPDLYIGWGDHVSCTHNQRQILYNRLMSTLLNRLAYNLHINVTTTRRDIPPVSPIPQHFIVQISTTNTSEIATPYDFIQGLIDSGHRVVTCIQTQPTTFGMSLCVKEVVSEDHHQWTNIPLGYFLQTGLSDIKGNEAYVCLPHSGLSLEISKGAIIHDANISIQHYMAIEGLCGWHSNHSANVPWIRPITCQDTTRYNNEVLESVRVAALQAIIINTVGTKYDLPFGGYGLTGVCNDSAAQIECAISKDGKTTHIFPLSFHGKFAMHTLRVANEMRQTLSSQNQMLFGSADEIKSIDRLIHAIMSLPSDTNTAPILDMIDQCERYIHCCTTGSSCCSTGPSAVSSNGSQNTTSVSTVATSDKAPPPAFQLLVESRSIVEAIRKEIVDISK